MRVGLVLRMKCCKKIWMENIIICRNADKNTSGYLSFLGKAHDMSCYPIKDFNRRQYEKYLCGELAWKSKEVQVKKSSKFSVTSDFYIECEF